MDRVDFQQKTIEDKLLALFDEIQVLKVAVRPRAGFVQNKEWWKISEVSSLFGKVYCTIEHYCQDLGINFKRINGLKVLSNEDVTAIAKYIKREDVLADVQRYN